MQMTNDYWYQKKERNFFSFKVWLYIPSWIEEYFSIKKRFLNFLIIARAILKRLTIFAILAKLADFYSYLGITFTRVNIFKNRFLILNLLFKTNSGRYIKPCFKRKRKKISSFLCKSNLTYCWKKLPEHLFWYQWSSIIQSRTMSVCPSVRLIVCPSVCPSVP